MLLNSVSLRICRILLVALSFVGALVISVVALDSTWTLAETREQEKAALTWPKRSATMTRSGVKKRSSSAPWFCLDVDYRLDNPPDPPLSGSYSPWPTPCSSDENEIQKIADGWPIGSRVEIYVDPDNPFDYYLAPSGRPTERSLQNKTTYTYGGLAFGLWMLFFFGIHWARRRE